MLTSSQLTEWIAYAELEPFGTGIEDQRTGSICASVLNAVVIANHDPKKGKPKFYEPKDFIPDYFNENEKEEAKPKQTVDEMLQVMKEIAGVKT